MFDCCRVPDAQGIDWSVSYAASPNPHDDLGHVIVMRRNRFWKIKAEVGGKVVGMGNLIRCGLSSRGDLSYVGTGSQIHGKIISCKVLIFFISPFPDDNTHICTTANLNTYMTTVRMNTPQSAS